MRLNRFVSLHASTYRELDDLNERYQRCRSRLSALPVWVLNGSKYDKYGVSLACDHRILLEADGYHLDPLDTEESLARLFDLTEYRTKVEELEGLLGHWESLADQAPHASEVHGVPVSEIIEDLHRMYDMAEGMALWFWRHSRNCDWLNDVPGKDILQAQTLAESEVVASYGLVQELQQDLQPYRRLTPRGFNEFVNHAGKAAALRGDPVELTQNQHEQQLREEAQARMLGQLLSVRDSARASMKVIIDHTQDLAGRMRALQVQEADYPVTWPFE